MQIGSSDQAYLSEKLMVINNKLVFCTPHETLNLARGAVYCKDLMRYSEEILEEKLKTQGVVKVEKIKKKIEEALTPTPLIIFFQAQVLPPTLRAA